MLFLECECDISGSNSTSCDTVGNCTCKSGFTGEKCDTCLSGYFQDTSGICQGIVYVSSLIWSHHSPHKNIFLFVFYIDCECDITGSNGLSCDSDGNCTCKIGYTEKKCDTCLSGYYQETSGICQGIVYV